mmetsp:Transcript_24168/g.58414  ORF Transcript_24168/g.58414 Transcript_24168/m.58414 type:complete len:190 (-) Transcript_24168:84-653(-)|eukprot:CAMPEP_0114507282 /NCGR_PEP_ID=MMETSP0109-20121206/11923_1 /TAXON_ID=29199 /ORGANISM="Chlorarachnion reptans, Strain CCCM449" /LENGTH=189 /DNA_ID=CAMNT_0001686017 /DNA_START=142 /DNA_END=711 /DNA_ORIENTATION=-
MEVESVSNISSIPLEVVGLYGETFSTLMPKGMKDMSEVRQVPNHQEFYADVESKMSVITEINEYQSKVEDSKAAAFFFENMAKDTDAKSIHVSSQGNLEIPELKDFSTSYIIGEHVVNQRIDNRGPVERVRVHIAVIRLKNVTSDMLLNLSIPVTDQTSNEHKALLEKTFFEMAKSFKVNSWAVFKGGA